MNKLRAVNKKLLDLLIVQIQKRDKRWKNRMRPVTSKIKHLKYQDASERKCINVAFKEDLEYCL